MQALLASLVVGMSVKDEAFRAAMATNRAEVKRTGQDFDKASDRMGGAMERGARTVNAAAIRVVDSVKSMGRAVNDQGLKLTAGLTLPLGLVAHTAKETASDFQAAMNNVHAAMLDVRPDQLDKLRAAALALGPAMGKSAIEAAGAIESLAKNGMSAADILGGGLENALKLGVLGQTNLGKAADATTDILQQFHLTTSALPGIVNKVSGALDASKLDFDGYADAIGMVGGIAGGLGYSFEDMNTALAAVIPLMTGGSDAGTSFKTFLLSLVPQSNDAKEAMAKLGITFKNADGSMKTLSEAAEVLHAKLDKLSPGSKQDALTKMFGSDGMRVALALMQAGAKGIADVQTQIDKASAGDKIAVLLDGQAAAAQRAASGWEQLKIAIGSAGIIQAYTAVNNAIGAVTSTIASAPPWFFKLAVGVGALAASIGPLILIVTKLATIALPLIALRLGPVALGFAALINPVGVLIRLLGALALQAGAATLIGRLGAAMVGLAGPIGLVIAALTILYPLLTRSAQASEARRVAVEAARKAEEAATNVSMQLAMATDQARAAILKKAEADRIAAVRARDKAKADVLAARAAYAVAQANSAKQNAAAEQTAALSVGAGGGEALAMSNTFTAARESRARANLVAATDALKGQQSALDILDKAIGDAKAIEAKPKLDMTFDDSKNKRKKRGRDTSADDEDYAAKLAEVRNAQLQAQADLTGSAEARYRADMDALASDRAAYARELATDQRLTDAKRATLLAEKDKEIEARKAVIEQTRSNALTQEGYDLARADNDARQELARAQIDLADSAAGRAAGELRLLDLQRQQEEADLDLILATKDSASAEADNARKRKAALAGVYAQRAEKIGRDSEGPGGEYLRNLDRSAAALSEDRQAGMVEALKGLNTGLTDAVMGTAKLADAFVDMSKRIVASLIDIAIQQAIIKPLANSLFGGIASAAASSTGSITAASNSAWLGGNVDFGGFRAKGGGVDPSSWYVVGEKGPEIFAPGVSGTVIPNGGRGARAGGTTVHQTIQYQGAVDIADRAYVDRMAMAAKQGAVQAIGAQRARAA